MRISKYFQRLLGMFSHSQSQTCMYSISVFLLSVSIYFTFTIVYTLWSAVSSSENNLPPNIILVFSWSNYFHILNLVNVQLSSYSLSSLTRLVTNCRSPLTAVSNRPVCRRFPIVDGCVHSSTLPFFSVAFGECRLLIIHTSFPSE